MSSFFCYIYSFIGHTILPSNTDEIFYDLITMINDKLVEYFGNIGKSKTTVIGPSTSCFGPSLMTTYRLFKEYKHYVYGQSGDFLYLLFLTYFNRNDDLFLNLDGQKWNKIASGELLIILV